MYMYMYIYIYIYIYVYVYIYICKYRLIKHQGVSFKHVFLSFKPLSQFIYRFALLKFLW